MTTFPYDHVITENLQTAAELIVNTRPADERVEWAAFLLHEMEAILSPAENEALLQAVQERIGGRLASGAW